MGAMQRLRCKRMTTNAVIIEDIHDLLALQKGLMEARFCSQPYDTGVSGSPNLARIHRNVIAAIRGANMPGGLSPDNWDRWLVIDDSRREWGIAVDRARSHSLWSRMTDAERRVLATDLLAPFILDEEVLGKFFRAVLDSTASNRPLIFNSVGESRQS